MLESWRQKEVVRFDSISTIADGIGVRIPIPECVQDMEGVIDDGILVKDASLIEAMRLAHEHLGHRARTVRCGRARGDSGESRSICGSERRRRALRRKSHAGTDEALAVLKALRSGALQSPRSRIRRIRNRALALRTRLAYPPVLNWSSLFLNRMLKVVSDP